jgi:hypothetical protein
METSHGRWCPTVAGVAAQRSTVPADRSPVHFRIAALGTNAASMLACASRSRKIALNQAPPVPDGFVNAAA